MNDQTVSVPFTLSELIELKASLESIRKVHTEIGMKYSVKMETAILRKLEEAKEQYIKMLEEE